MANKRTYRYTAKELSRLTSSSVRMVNGIRNGEFDDNKSEKAELIREMDRVLAEAGIEIFDKVLDIMKKCGKVGGIELSVNAIEKQSDYQLARAV